MINVIVHRIDWMFLGRNCTHMLNQEGAIADFFNHYAARVNRALRNDHFDIDGIVESFTDDFIGANPHGVSAGKNGQTFREAIANGWNFYKDIGIRSMNILAKKITFLDEFHAMVRIQWKSLFTAKDGRDGEIKFEVIYLLQMRDGKIKIFAYITGDELQALKDAGLQ